jgi:hypothetical protein
LQGIVPTAPFERLLIRSLFHPVFAVKHLRTGTTDIAATAAETTASDPPSPGLFNIKYSSEKSTPSITGAAIVQPANADAG